MNNAQRILPFIGRILVAVLFLMSGFGKISAPEATIGYIASAHLPLPTVGYGISLAVEVVGGLLLVVGYRTRMVAAVLALFTLGAALAFHNNFADQNQMIHFMKNIAIIGGLFQIVAFGAGGFSIDARRAKN